MNFRGKFWGQALRPPDMEVPPWVTDVPGVIIITLLSFGQLKKKKKKIMKYIDIKYMLQRSFVFTKNCSAIVVSEQ